MKYSVKTIRTLIRLRDGDSVNEGEFRSGQMKELLTELNSQNALSSFVLEEAEVHTRPLHLNGLLRLVLTMTERFQIWRLPCVLPKMKSAPAPRKLPYSVTQSKMVLAGQSKGSPSWRTGTLLSVTRQGNTSLIQPQAYISSIGLPLQFLSR